MLTNFLKASQAASVVLWIAGPAHACFICDEIVEFDAITAQCFLDNVRSFLEKAQTDKNSRVEVNLSNCAQGRSIDSFPSLNGRKGDDATGVGLIYTLEAASVECLAAKLQSIKITGILTLVIEEECGGE